jgi:hypothetical protein
LERRHIDWPIRQFFGNIVGHIAPNRSSTSLDPQLKNRKEKCSLTFSPVQFIYMGIELWANHMGS